MFDAAIAHNSRVNYLRLKVKTQTATQTEADELHDAVEFIGGIDRGGVIVVPAACLSVAEWEAKAAASPDPTYRASSAGQRPPSDDAPSADGPTQTVDALTGDTIIVCRPGHEPKPKGRENLRRG